MKRILVSGNVNLETNLSIEGFPVQYKAVRYAQNQIQTNVGGVAYNVSKALATLGDDVSLLAMLGDDQEGERIRSTLAQYNIDTARIRNTLSASPSSVVLHDSAGRRAIFTDTKNLQSSTYDFMTTDIENFDLVVACNVNFNRDLLYKAHQANVLIATDVHTLDNPRDGYNQEFMEYADILFLSDEHIWIRKREFFETLRDLYPCKIIVMGCGSSGAMMYLRENDRVYKMDAIPNENPVNTLGAGDALFSSFLHFVSNGYSPLEALKRAQIFASHKISYNGASIGFLSAYEVNRIAKDTQVNIRECW